MKRLSLPGGFVIGLGLWAFTQPTLMLAGPHWAFQRLSSRQPPLPKPAGAEHERTPIDRFLATGLAKEGLTFAGVADRKTLLRRVSFDLTGLPPTPAYVQAFEHDNSPNAYERLVDRLLASPALGERWAQHWLDAVRFAESDGFEFDHIRPEAWKYRDWVIDALNSDLPYDRFVQCQLAGDELATDDPSSAVATGMLLGGPDMVDINSMDERRHNVLNEMTSTVGAVFLGMSVGCAQCHDHKTDPVSTKDFYQFRALFANTVVAPKKLEQLPPVVDEPGVEAPPSFVMVRGDYRRKGEAVAPALLPALNTSEMEVDPPPPGASSSQRRLALARWLTQPNHPLTARVMVNRLWLHHFGQGLVKTPNDFGPAGTRPTHPALLDWLAAEFIRCDWSMKAMHRLMVTSTVYLQAGRGTDAAWRERLQRDSLNELYSRMNRRRLEGEAIRDTMLQAAETLNRKQGGESVRPPLPPEVTITLLKDQWPVTADKTEHLRRSIYLFVRRNLRYPMFDVFDRPDTNAPCPERNVSTIAPQSLTLLNSELSMRLAETVAERLLIVHPGVEEQVSQVYLRILQRTPVDDEMKRALAFLESHAQLLEREPPINAARRALANLCLGLMNTNEAVYID